jgi:hypothetical protein
MDKKTPPPYSIFPASAKKGILFLLLGWTWHFFFLYLFFYKRAGTVLETQLWLQQSAIALLVCFFTIRVRNWARVLCIIANLLIISLYILTAAHFFSLSIINFAIFAAVNVILFSISTYFLFIKETSDFFKLHSPRLGENKSKEK